MKPRCNPFWAGQRRWPTSRGTAARGTTLIEVLAGLVVLGTLLAAVAIARGRFLRQWADADRRIVVTQAADRLLAQWFSGPAPSVPVHGDGSLEALPGCEWRTSVLQDAGSN